MEKYSHKQSGHLVFLTLSFLLVSAIFILSFFYGSTIIGIGTALVLAIISFLFSSLTVEVDDEIFHWHFSYGFLRKQIPLKNIVSAKAVRNKWWYGWGVHWTPDGWLFNVTGLSAVEVVLTDGKKIRVGTNEPDLLEKALLSRLG